MTFQEIILTLQNYWAAQKCVIGQPYDVEKGAGTMNPSTFLRALGPEPWNVAYVEPSRRPADVLRLWAQPAGDCDTDRRDAGHRKILRLPAGRFRDDPQ